MAAEVALKITGLADVRRALLDVAPKLRRKALRNALAAGARVVRDEARRLAPTLKPSTYYGAAALRRGVRSIGTLRKAINVRTSKASTRRGDVGVFVNVRPLKGGGAKNPKDPYYWRWVEFGWKPHKGSRLVFGRLLRRLKRIDTAPVTFKPGAKFLSLSAAKLGQAKRRIEEELGPQLRKLNVRNAPL
jgi:HK97 gp10 family phage protein